jgi:non-ribosomal peptide synthetase component F
MAQAQSSADCVTIKTDSEVLTYSQLETQANQLAAHLRSFHVGPEVLVAICLERSPQFIIAALAVMKCGAGYSPLDPQDPAERLRFMVKDADAEVVVTNQSSAELFAELDVRLVALDPGLIASALEELLRYESPSQHTGRIARQNVEMGGKQIRKGQAVMAIMAAANRDPERFRERDRLILDRKDNGWSSHSCFGAPPAWMEGQIAFETILRGLKNLELSSGSLKWRENSGLRGLTALPVTFSNN